MRSLLISSTGIPLSISALLSTLKDAASDRALVFCPLKRFSRLFVVERKGDLRPFSDSDAFESARSISGDSGATGFVLSVAVVLLMAIDAMG
jgi:hypothetical protein